MGVDVPRPIYGAIQHFDRPVGELDSQELLGDIARISHALAIGTKAVGNDRSILDYSSQIVALSPVQSDGNLEKLLLEARKRASTPGSVNVFMAVVDGYVALTPGSNRNNPTDFAMALASSNDAALLQYLPRHEVGERPIPRYMYS